MTCEIFQCGPDRVLGEDGAVDLHGRQTSQGVHNILFRVFTDLLNRGSLHHFCQHRPGSDRGGTSEGFEARSRDVTISNLQVQMQNIPTGGVLRYADGIRILQGTDIRVAGESAKFGVGHP